MATETTTHPDRSVSERLGPLVAAAVACSLALVGCHHYGKATPKSCHAKFIRGQRGGPGDYERCLDGWQRAEEARQYARDKQRLKQLRVRAQIDALEQRAGAKSQP